MRPAMANATTSGGDMMNKGAPSWSDRYQCAEWSWLNGVADAMALGNHELGTPDVPYHSFFGRGSRDEVAQSDGRANVPGPMLCRAVAVAVALLVIAPGDTHPRIRYSVAFRRG